MWKKGISLKHVYGGHLYKMWGMDATSELCPNHNVQDRRQTGWREVNSKAVRWNRDFSDGIVRVLKTIVRLEKDSRENRCSWNWNLYILVCIGWPPLDLWPHYGALHELKKRRRKAVLATHTIRLPILRHWEPQRANNMISAPHTASSPSL